MANQSEKRNRLMQDLDELVNFLNDGPEHQRQIPLPQAGLFNENASADSSDPPVLTAFIGEPPPGSAEAAAAVLVDEMVEELMPILERELKRRLKARISKAND